MSKLSYRLKSFYYSYIKPSKSLPKPPYSHVVQLGDPILRYKSDPVPVLEIESAETQKTIKEMKSVMKLFYVSGLSAPQIGIGKRIMALYFPKKEDSNYEPKKYDEYQMEEVPLQFWINPEMRVIDWDKVSHVEGCASLKGLCANVPRYKKVALKGYDENAKEKTLEASGWTARIIQHEMDHLDGNFFTDIMEPKTFHNFGWQYINFNKGRVKIDYGPQFEN